MPTKIMHRKLNPWTIAYYSPDYDEIHIDKKFEGTPIYNEILAHEFVHSKYKNNNFKSFMFDITEIIKLKQDLTTFKAFKFKPFVMLNIFWFITFPIDYIEFLLWKKGCETK